MVKLTLIDKKILQLIEYNPRISFQEIAKATRISKDSAKYRLLRLEEKKVILQYTSFVDYKKLGHESYKLFLKIKATTEQKNKLRDYLCEQKNVFAVFESFGAWNFAFATFAKTSEEFNSIENDLLEKFGNIIIQRRFCSMIDATFYPSKIFAKERDEQEFHFWGKVKHKEIDDIDRIIIKTLHNNARESLTNIALKTKLSLDATKKRINKLRKNGVMSIHRTNINYDLLGFTHYKLLIFPKKYSQKKENEIKEVLKRTKGCINVVRTIGPWKIEAEFLFENNKEVDAILEKLEQNYSQEILDLEMSPVRNEELFACKELLLQ